MRVFTSSFARFPLAGLLTFGLVALPALAVTSHAQTQKTDLIYRTDGSTIPAKVEKVGINEIEYRKPENPSGPLYAISRSEVSSILYANGVSETLTKAPAQTPTPAPTPAPAATPTPPLEIAALPATATPAATTAAAPASTDESKGFYASDGYVSFGRGEGITFTLMGDFLWGNKKKAPLLSPAATVSYGFNSGGTITTLTGGIASPMTSLSKVVPYFKAQAGILYYSSSLYRNTLLMTTLGGGSAFRVGNSGNFFTLGVDANIYSLPTAVELDPSNVSYLFKIGFGFASKK